MCESRNTEKILQNYQNKIIFIFLFFFFWCGGAGVFLGFEYLRDVSLHHSPDWRNSPYLCFLHDKCVKQQKRVW